METKPKEQTFDFMSNPSDERLVQWIASFGRIPLDHFYGETFRETIEKLLSLDSFESSGDFCEVIHKDTGFTIHFGGVHKDNPNLGYGDWDEGADIFTICVIPSMLKYKGVETEMYCAFLPDDKVLIGIWDNDYEMDNKLWAGYTAQLGTPNDYVSWQEAYDLLCKIARADQNAIPECNIG